MQGPRGAAVNLYVGEDLRSDGAAEISPRFYATRYRLAGGERERVEGFEAVGFRYLSVIARGGARVENAGAIERRYPRSPDARFSCDDDRLNALWRIGARTLDVCSTDAFLDCPFREQRAWLGDSYIHALLTYVTSTDWRLVRRHLRICAQSQRADGLLAMVAAGDFSRASTTIPDFSLHWVRALARYLEYSGDIETVRELIPVAVDVLDAFERFRAADGLIRRMPGWLFVELGDDRAGRGRGRDRCAICGRAAGLRGDERPSRRCGTGRRRTAARGAHDRGLRDALGRSAGECTSMPPMILALAAASASRPTRPRSSSGCAPQPRWGRIIEWILDPRRIKITPTISDNRGAYVRQHLDPSAYMEFDPEQNVVAAQPFFSHFLHQAIVRAGRRDLIPKLCMRWWPQIERGNTTFEEYWDGPSGEASRCHAWAATPTYDLTTHVLGVRPAAAGYTRAEIRPLFGWLTRLEGRVPTPHGMIEIDIDRERGGTIAIPQGIAVELGFDDAPLRGGAVGPGRHAIPRA